MARTIPPHSTENRYTNHGCRCEPCRTAAAEGRAARKRRAAYAEWTGRHARVDAAPVRQHIADLRMAGLSIQNIIDLAGVGSSVVRHILYGTHGEPPARQVLRPNAEALLRVRADVDGMPASARVDGAGTRRRIQALMTLGWTSQDLADRIGYTRTYVTALTGRERATAAAAQRVRRAYGELSMRIPPDTALARRTRSFAARKGWLPPLAWDDLIDIPDAELEHELQQRVALMDNDELQRCDHARRRLGDRSPLVVAASREYDRRRHRAAELRKRQEREAAA
jgi:AraC-like DNA-binding protein